jgi:hypothetical protein
MITLCEDMIHEILNRSDSKSIASILSVNKYYYSLSHKNTTMINRRRLGHELKKTIVNTRKYYTSEILNLKIGDRVTDRIRNYRVADVTKKLGVLEEVDMYGNGMDSYIYTEIYNVKKYKLKNEKNNSFWSTFYYDEFQNTTIINKLNYGIIKHDYGPIIKNVDSHYLNYKTLPQYIYYSNDNIGEPELNILVSVCYNWYVHEYYVDIYDENFLRLQLIKKSIISETIRDAPCAEPIITADKINNKWVIKNKKYKIVYFGGWNVNSY